MRASDQAGLAAFLIFIYVGKIPTSNQCVIDSHGIGLYDRAMSEPSPGAPGGSQLHGPVARLLRPLVRLLIKSGVTFPALCDLLRELYVNVAEYDFALPDKSQTDSRVSLLTGIHRKEVRRLRGAGRRSMSFRPLFPAPARFSRAGSARPNSPMKRAGPCRWRATPGRARPHSMSWSPPSRATCARAPFSTNGSTGAWCGSTMKIASS